MLSYVVEVGVSVDTSITLTEGEEREVCLTTLGTVETDTPISISVIPETADENGRCDVYKHIVTMSNIMYICTCDGVLNQSSQILLLIHKC